MHRTLALLLAGCAGAATVPPAPDVAPAPPAEASPAPKLVVLIVVDQLGQAQLDRLSDRFTGGFARLTGDQAWVQPVDHRHAATETCPGHATLATGAAPRVHGVVGNSFRIDGEERYCLEAGPLPVQSIGDVVSQAGGDVVALSLKDRGASLIAGRQPTLVSWLDRKTGAEMTGTFSAQTPVEPPLVPPERWRGWLEEPWVPLDPNLGATFQIPEEQPHEADFGMGQGFPKIPVSEAMPPERQAKGLMLTPHGGDFLVHGALEALDRFGLGLDATPDLLSLSFSHFDGIGHAFTPHSAESLDALLRLDLQLEELFVGLDAHVGEGQWAVVLSGDHGAPMVPPTYVDVAPIAAQVAAAWSDAGLPPPALDPDYRFYLADGMGPEDRQRALEIAREVARAHPGVDDVIDLANPAGETAAAWALNHMPPRSPDLHLLFARDHVALYKNTPKGTSHGMPYDYDQRVPLLVYGAGVSPGQGGVGDTRSVAPTVAALMGLPAPDGAEVPAPAEALQRPAAPRP